MLSKNHIIEKRLHNRMTYWYRHNGALLPAHRNAYGGYSLVSSPQTAKLEEKILEKNISMDTKTKEKETKAQEKEHAEENKERQTKISAAIAKALKATTLRKSAGLRKQA
jgi:vacuolar-type H+-ATPase subunit I/STV1